MPALRFSCLALLLFGITSAGCDTRDSLARSDDGRPPAPLPDDGGAPPPPEPTYMPEQEPNGSNSGGLTIIRQGSPVLIAGTAEADDRGLVWPLSADDFEDLFSIETQGSPTVTLFDYEQDEDLALLVVGPFLEEGGFANEVVADEGFSPTESVTLPGSGLYLVGVSYVEGGSRTGESDYKLRVEW